MSLRRGVALIAAVLLLSLLALLTAGAFAAASLTRRSGTAVRADAVVLADADFALTSVLSSWPESGAALYAVGQEHVVAGSHGAADSVATTRLANDVYWVVATSWVDSPARAYRRLNLLVRLPVIRSLPAAAMVTAGDVSIGPGVAIDHDTTQQNGVACGATSVGVVLAPGAKLIAVNGGSLSGMVSANQASAGDTSTYTLGPEGWGALAARPTQSFPPGAHITVTPAAILYGSGDLAIDGGSGQGVLLVSGRLTIAGPVTFRGLIVVRGGVAVSGSLDLTGAIMSAASSPTPVALQSTALHYSACAISDAARSAALPRPTLGRAWMEMF